MAQFILGATAAFVFKQPMPAKPGMKEDDEADADDPKNFFDGRLDYVDFEKGYVRCVFSAGANPLRGPHRGYTEPRFSLSQSDQRAAEELVMAAPTSIQLKPVSGRILVVGSPLVPPPFPSHSSIVFGESGAGTAAVYDGEFLFFDNDEVVNVRVGRRGDGGREWQGSQPAIFSYTTARCSLGSHSRRASASARAQVHDIAASSASVLFFFLIAASLLPRAGYQPLP